MEGLKPEIIKEKGKPGRRLGSKNKTTRDMRSKYARFLEMSFKDIQKAYSKLPIQDKIKLHNQVANLIVPKASVVRQETLNAGGNDNTPMTITLELNDSGRPLPGIGEGEAIPPEGFELADEVKTNQEAYAGLKPTIKPVEVVKTVNYPII